MTEQDYISVIIWIPPVVRSSSTLAKYGLEVIYQQNVFYVLLT